jgi:hypothetical protein
VEIINYIKNEMIPLISLINTMGCVPVSKQTHKIIETDSKLNIQQLKEGKENNYERNSNSKKRRNFIKVIKYQHSRLLVIYEAPSEFEMSL